MTSQSNSYGAPLNGLWPADKSHPSDVIVGNAPIASFQVKLDATWIRCAFERWHPAQRRVNPWLVAPVVGIAAALVCYYFIFKAEPEIDRTRVSLWMGAGGALATLAISFLLRRTVKNATVQNFRRSKDFETIHTVMFSGDEVVTLGPTGVSARRWSGIFSSRRFKDGVLIVPDRYHFLWLPWSDLASGTVDDVDAILRANVANYKGTGV